jgi:hypothetical protein
VEKTSQAFSQTALSIATNQHMIIIEHFIGQLKEVYGISLFAINFAQEGNFSPQIITTGDVIRDFKTPIRFLHVTFPYLPPQEWLTNTY